MTSGGHDIRVGVQQKRGNSSVALPLGHQLIKQAADYSLRVLA